MRDLRDHPSWCSFMRSTAVVPITLVPQGLLEDAPAPAPARHKRARVSPSVSSAQGTQGTVAESPVPSFSFSDTFGVLGPSLLFVVVVCILWTTWLIVLTFAPSWTANYLMNTEGYDDGNFWLIIESEPWIQVLSGFGLLTIVVCYVYVLVTMLFWRNKQRGVDSIRLKSSHSRWLAVLLILLPRVCMSAKWRRRQNTLIASWNDLTGFNGCNRKFWNLWLKCIDLTLQTIALIHMLESGFPSALNYGYAVLLAANALSCVVMIWLGTLSSAFFEVLVDTIFDLLFAVVFPIVVLVYCYSTFEFDREVLELNVAVFPAGGFERQARMVANPSELFLFRTSFDSLRIQTPLEFLLRIGMNLSFCNRLKRVIEIQIARRTRLGRRSVMARWRSRYPSLANLTRYHHHRVPRWLAIPFVTFSVAVLVYTKRSETASASACASYPECITYARRWRPAGLCPCLILVDADKSPRTYDEWIHPVDMTSVVTELAKSGDLRVLQLINRRLAELPAPLRRCTDLKHMHIEGKSGFRNLESLPEDFFAGMPTLAYLHLGVHPYLPKLPSFRGLTSIKRMMLAYLFGITEIPSMDPLSKLERLNLVYLSGVPRLPDLTPLRRQLRTLTLYRPNQACCNGFIGACNLSHPYCAANAPLYIPSDVRCIQDEAPLATTTTLEIMRANAKTVCQNPTLQIPETPTKDSIDTCQGVLYRECQRFRDDAVDDGNGTHVLDTGICFNTRMQVLTCTLDPLKVTLRKQQILHRVGPICDPEVEAWLGCTG